MVETSQISTNSIYTPSEDTFALIDAILDLGTSFEQAVEIGCGSGRATLEIAKKVNRLVATDLDFRSTVETHQALKRHGLRDTADVLCCSVADALRPDSKFDFVTSNPPYLPTDASEARDTECSYAGGPDGSAVAKKIVEAAVSHSTSRSTVLLVLSSLTNAVPLQELLEKNSFEVKIEQRRSLFFEQLFVLHASRKQKE